MTQCKCCFDVVENGMRNSAVRIFALICRLPFQAEQHGLCAVRRLLMRNSDIIGVFTVQLRDLACSLYQRR